MPIGAGRAQWAMPFAVSLADRDIADEAEAIVLA